MGSSEKRTLYLIPYVHLDTQWRWTTATTISKYLPDTIEKNLSLIEEFPQYSINFTGAYRYALLEEYYPDLFQKVKKAVEAHNWHPSGSMWEETDVLIPSAESIIRNLLYGKNYFQSHFGRSTQDVMLPDSFGFLEDFPTLLTHCRIIGFSTQKMTWDPVKPIPFDIGIWNGSDGSSLPTVLRPGRYESKLRIPPHLNPKWLRRMKRHKRNLSISKAVRYYGDGDIGGAPSRLSIKNALCSARGTGAKTVTLHGESDLFFKQLEEQERSNLPRYAGELLLTKHSTGTLSSQHMIKRWNKRCEQLAFLADTSSVIASEEVHVPYPKELLEKGWKQLIANQMHDTLPGTCTPEAYKDTYNSLILIANTFNGIIDDAVMAIARQLPLRKYEQAIGIVNPNSYRREELLEVELPLREDELLTIYDKDGHTVPFQEISSFESLVQIALKVIVPPVGWTSYRFTTEQRKEQFLLPVTMYEDTVYLLENDCLMVEVNESGNISSIIDKRNNKEMLQAPIEFVCLAERPSAFPSWNMDWKDRKKGVETPLPPAHKIYFSKRGTFITTLTIERTLGESRFVHMLSVHHTGCQDMIYCQDRIFWQGSACSLKLSIPLSFSNESATYALDTVQVPRSENSSHMYEYPSKGWIDQESENGAYGFSFIHADIYGSDRPNDHTLRPTLLYTPGRNIRNFAFLDQMTQDWGRHTLSYGLHPHIGSWKSEHIESYCSQIANPLRPYLITRERRALRNHLNHPSSSSFITFSTNKIDLITCKRSEEDQSFIILRVREMIGGDIPSALITFNTQIDEAYEVDGMETPIRSVTILGKAISFSIERNSIKSFAVRLQNQDVAISIDSARHAPIQIETQNPEQLLSEDFCDENIDFSSPSLRYTHIPLPYNISTCTFDQQRTPSGDITFPLELLPGSLKISDIHFPLHLKDECQALACGGEQIEIPQNQGDNTPGTLHLIITSTDGRDCNLSMSHLNGDISTERFHVPPFTGYIGQYDTRIWKHPARSPRDYLWWNRFMRLDQGYVYKQRVAWYTTHMHAGGTNLPHQFGYLYYVSIPLKEDTRFIVLPEDIRIHIYAAAVSSFLVNAATCRVESDPFDL